VVAVAILSACFVREVNGGFLDPTPIDKLEALIPEADAKIHLMENKNQEQKQQVALDTKVDKKQDKGDDHWTPQESWEKRATEARDRATQDLGARATGARARWKEVRDTQRRERGIGADPMQDFVHATGARVRATQGLGEEVRAHERTRAERALERDVYTRRSERGFGSESWERGIGAQEARPDERRWAYARPTNEARVDERRWADARPARRSGFTNSSSGWMNSRWADARPARGSGLTNDAQVNDAHGQDMDRVFASVQKIADRAEQLDYQASQVGASYRVKKAADQALKELEEADAYAQSMYKEAPLANINLMVVKAGKKDNKADKQADEEDMDNEANEEDNEADEDNEEHNEAGEDNDADMSQALGNMLLENEEVEIL